MRAYRCIYIRAKRGNPEMDARNNKRMAETDGRRGRKIICELAAECGARILLRKREREREREREV